MTVNYTVVDTPEGFREVREWTVGRDRTKTSRLIAFTHRTQIELHNGVANDTQQRLAPWGVYAVQRERENDALYAATDVAAADFDLRR